MSEKRIQIQLYIRPNFFSTQNIFLWNIFSISSISLLCALNKSVNYMYIIYIYLYLYMIFLWFWLIFCGKFPLYWLTFCSPDPDQIRTFSWTVPLRRVSMGSSEISSEKLSYLFEEGLYHIVGLYNLHFNMSFW